MTARTLLVLGGARSGKSRYAQVRAEAFDREQVFIATGQAFDAEMADRIARHRDERGASWRTVEAPLDLAGAIAKHGTTGRVLLIDCLTLWTSNLLLAAGNPVDSMEAVAGTIAEARADIVLVSNEVGLGIVPDNALARRFRDAAGWVNQRVAGLVDEVQFVAAGLPLRLK